MISRTRLQSSLILNNLRLLYAFFGKVFKLSGAWVIYRRQMPPSLVLQLPQDALGELGALERSTSSRRSIIRDENCPATNERPLRFPPLSGDMDISVFSKYISDMKRVYPAVEGRITFSTSSTLVAPGLGFLLLALLLSTGL